MTIKISKFISYFFHPINFPIIGTFLYFLFIPKFIFKPQEYSILLIVFFGTYIFPLFILAVLKRFGMIQSFYLHSVEERKFPIILFVAISYIIGNWLFKSSLVDLLALSFYGYCGALFISYLLLHVKLKISLHTTAIGGLIGFLLYFSYHYQINIIITLALLIILSGIIGTSRLTLKAHSLKEVYAGYFVGFLAQILLYLIYNI